jgi:WD40 repeat protein
MQILEGHSDVVPALAFSPDGSLLASIDNQPSNQIRIWQFPGGVERDVLSGPPCAYPRLDISPDGRWLAALTSDGAWVWDLSRPGIHREIVLKDEPPLASSWPLALAFSPDGSRLLLSGERGQARLEWPRPTAQATAQSWEVGAWTELSARDFEIPSEGVWRHPWALDAHGLILATPDGQNVVFWDCSTGKELFRVASKSRADPAALSFSPDGKRFAIARARSVDVYDVAQRRLLASWKNSTPKYVLSLAFSPDGRTLITVSNDTAARLWDVETGGEKAALAWGAGQLKAVAFAPDGMRAAASGKKGTIVVWDID